MSKFKNKIFAHMEITHALVKMQVDSRASCNMLPGKFLPRDTEIKKTNLKLTTYSKTNLKVCDNIPANWESKEQEEVSCWICNPIDEDYSPLLGSLAAQQIGLITVQLENILQVRESYLEFHMDRNTATYPDTIEGLGCMEGALHLEVDESGSPSIMPQSCTSHPERKTERGASPRRKS